MDRALADRGGAAYPSRMGELQAGDVVGDYEIIDCLGRSSSYATYVAHLATGDLCHIRLVMKRFESDDALTPHHQLYFQEAGLGLFLSHPNIAQLYDLAKDGGYPFLIYEYVHGESAAQIARRGRFSVPAVLTLGMAVARGLDYAHNLTANDGAPLHVVHGGVSPSTVLVGYDGNVKLIDFECGGLLRARPPTRVALGYMSPEQVRGQPADHRSDLFSLGVVLYELLTGTSPFVRDSEFATMEAILRRPLPPETRRALDTLGCPEALAQVVMATLERDPTQRPQSARELGAALAAVAHSERLECSPQVLAQLLQVPSLRG